VRRRLTRDNSGSFDGSKRDLKFGILSTACYCNNLQVYNIVDLKSGMLILYYR
jgi:hypothetical protein